MCVCVCVCVCVCARADLEGVPGVPWNPLKFYVTSSRGDDRVPAVGQYE